MSRKSRIKICSNRSFGLVFFFVFLIIGFWPSFDEGQIRIWSIIIGIVFLILGLMNSKLLTPLNRLWFKFGMLLGAIIAPGIAVQFKVYAAVFLLALPVGYLLFRKMCYKTVVI